MIKVNKIFFRLHSNYKTISSGTGFDKKISLISQDGKPLSFWRDIPYQTNGVFNAVIEIPKYNLAKMEMKKEDPFHSIVQDTRINVHTKQKELRHYAQFPPFSYGFIPQTWESKYDKFDSYYGDNDPIDIIELGSRTFEIGTIIPIKILGCLCLIDQGELDWKVITINKFEAEEKKIDNLEQIENKYPGLTNMIKNWFKNIKTFDGKKPNSFHKDIFSSGEAIEEIEKTHHYWKQLLKDEKYVEDRKKFHL